MIVIPNCAADLQTVLYDLKRSPHLSLTTTARNNKRAIALNCITGNS